MSNKKYDLDKTEHQIVEEYLTDPTNAVNAMVSGIVNLATPTIGTEAMLAVLSGYQGGLLQLYLRKFGITEENVEKMHGIIDVITEKLRTDLNDFALSNTESESDTEPTGKLN